MVLRRWLTGIVALPVLIYIIGPGPRWLYHLLIAAAGLTGLYEFHSIACRELPKGIKGTNLFLALCLFFLASRGESYFIPAVIFMAAAVPLTLFMFLSGTSDQRAVYHSGLSLLGSVYICLPLAFLVIIERYPMGKVWIFFLLSVVFASDTGAFYCGRLWGRHALYSAVSPKKTWEGAVGGFLGGLLAACLFCLFMPVDKGIPVVLGLAGALSVSGQVGDLVESMIKRIHAVKDSGMVLPGHGGILDRIDGLLFAGPILYLFLSLST